jgi:hypothetical protein
MVYLRCVTLTYWLALTVGLLHPKGGELSGLLLGPSWEYPDPSHLIAFAVLSALVHACRLRSPFLSSPITLCVYGVATETGQFFVPGRHAMVMHGLANLLGIAVGTALCWLLVEPLLRRRQHSTESSLRLLQPGTQGDTRT